MTTRTAEIDHVESADVEEIPQWLVTEEFLAGIDNAQIHHNYGDGSFGIVFQSATDLDLLRSNLDDLLIRLDSDPDGYFDTLATVIRQLSKIAQAHIDQHHAEIHFPGFALDGEE